MIGTTTNQTILTVQVDTLTIPETVATLPLVKTPLQANHHAVSRAIPVRFWPPRLGLRATSYYVVVRWLRQAMPRT